MKEPFLRHLRPEVTQQLLPLAQRLAGKPPLIKRLDSLPNEVNGVLLPPQRQNGPWELHYARGQERFLEYVIAHELGHIVRLHQVPAEERYCRP